MIMVVVNRERNPRTGKLDLVVSHGIDMNTGKNAVLPQEGPAAVGAVMDMVLGEYVIRDSSDAKS